MVKELAYDAPLEQVTAMLSDPSFRERVLEHQRVSRGKASVDGDVVEVRRVHAAKGLPSFATKFVGDEIEIIQVERWTRQDHADVEVTIPGKPGAMTGTIALAESAGRTTQNVSLEIRIKLPLIGGKAEGLVRDLMVKALDKEYEVGVAWLAGS